MEIYNTEALRDISIVEYLASRGFEPAHSYRGDMWYHSPLRKGGDRKPSFVVHTHNNKWWDFSEGRGGDIFDLVKGLSGNPALHFGEVCSILEAYDPLAAQRVSPVFPQVPSEPRAPSLSVESVGTVSDMYSLFDYLCRNRKLNPFLAERNGLKAVFYTTSDGKRRYALGFPNDEGGYELRNAYFKGTCGRKSLSCSKLVSGKDTPSHINVFEGFMDYLSFAELNPTDESAYIILNSTALTDRAIEKIKAMTEVFIRDGHPNTSVRLYLDKDEAGERATQTITEAFKDDRRIGIYDMRPEFSHANDINEYLQKVRREPPRKLSKPILKRPFKL